jgi:hypothetical protein
LEHCTFTPSINKEYSLGMFNRQSDTFQRLYTDHERYNQKKLLQLYQKDCRDSNISTFSPDISVTNVKNINNSIRTKFFDRQKTVNYKYNIINNLV